MRGLIRRLGGAVKRVPRPQSRLHIEELSSRVLPAVPGVFTNNLGALIVNGTPLADTVHISTSGDQVVVDFNGKDYPFDLAKVQQIIFNGGAGGDFCENLTNLPSILRGGNGADTLNGGGAADKLFGQYGPDQLDGNGGNDTASGGMGADWIEGALGDDSLLGNLGPDKIFGGLGADTCLGGGGTDQVSGGYGDNVAVGEVLNTEIGLIAILTSDSGAVGVAQWSQTTGDLQLLIVNAPANSTLDVVLDGNKIGEISTDDFGIGTLDLQDASLPVSNGSTLQVGDLSGQFADFSAANTLLVAMVGPNFEIGAGEYSAAQNHFDVAVIADANTTYGVFVDVNADGNFVQVGDITTDDLGIGSLTLDPLPAGFPAIHDGSVLKIGDILQGAFAPLN